METEFERKKKAEKFAGKFHMKEFYSRACVSVICVVLTCVCVYGWKDFGWTLIIDGEHFVTARFRDSHLLYLVSSISPSAESRVAILARVRVYHSRIINITDSKR